MLPGGWVAVALGALLSAQLVQCPLTTAPAMAVALWLLRHKLSPYARILFLAVLGLSALRANARIANYLQEREAIRQELGAQGRCSGEGVVRESPVLRQGKFVIVVFAENLDCGTALGQHSVRLSGGPDGIARGDIVQFVAQLGLVAPLRQLELPDPIPRVASKGVTLSGGALSVEVIARGHSILSLIDRARSWVRRRILATYAPSAEALGRALVLGENDLDAEDQLAFQKSGLSHLLAVSGTHLVFAVASLVQAIRAILLRWQTVARRTDVRRWASLFGAVLALLYADFAGGSGSAVRAALMLAGLYLATFVGRRLRGIQALSYSILFGVIRDPLVGYDISFLLSAGATAGLIVIGPVLAAPLERVNVKAVKIILQALMTTCSAMIPCVPLLLTMSPELSLAGLFANVIAGPIGEMFALPICLLHAIAAPLAWLESGLSLAGSGALIFVAKIAKISASMAFARLALAPPTEAQFACIGITALCLVLTLKSESAAETPKRIRIAAALLSLVGALSYGGLEVVARRAFAPTGMLRVTAVDVGQGDALLIDLPNGELMLVDGGGAVTGGPDPGQFILAPLLRARRRKQIDVAVLTHPHPDHYGGLVTLLPQLEVREFWSAGELPGESRTSEVSILRQELRRRKTIVRTLAELCQAPRRFGKGMVEVLGPCPDVNPALEANNQSIVLKLSLGRRSALLPGDAEMLAEKELIARHGSHLRADLLKLGHHGSRTSTSLDWLNTVRPAMAVVSVGLRNRFGHPHFSTIARLARAHVPVYRTDELGSVQWMTNGEQIDVAMVSPRTLLRN